MSTNCPKCGGTETYTESQPGGGIQLWCRGECGNRFVDWIERPVAKGGKRK